uniref:Uncharacterized protein n=1 Tax=Panagrolaimus sp. JU765 TaxID=591449 RepID=A0AC34RML4_9BILA
MPKFILDFKTVHEIACKMPSNGVIKFFNRPRFDRINFFKYFQKWENSEGCVAGARIEFQKIRYFPKELESDLPERPRENIVQIEQPQQRIENEESQPQNEEREACKAAAFCLIIVMFFLWLFLLGLGNTGISKNETLTN